MIKRPQILIADDFELNRMILKNLLEDDYDIIEAVDGIDTIDMVTKNLSTISLILLDIMMPGLDGFEVLEILESYGLLMTIPVILITASQLKEFEKKGLAMGAVDFISKPFDNDIVRKRVDVQIKFKLYRDNLTELVEISVQKLDSVWDIVLNTLASVIEYRSIESGEHVHRTQTLTKMMLDKMKESPDHKFNLGEKDVGSIIKASTLHDIGKIGIKDGILLKPGKLDSDEFEQIKQHSLIGDDIAKRFLTSDNEDYVKYCREVARYHHEKWDGTGYPDNLKETEIPLAARIVSIVDVFDALMSDRVYKKAYPFEESIDIIKESSGKNFDPVLVDIFLSMQTELHDLYTKEVEDDQSWRQALKDQLKLTRGD